MKVNAKEHAHTYRVYFNEFDISSICVEADDNENIAEVIITFAGNLDYGVSSSLIDKDGECITATIYGDVRIEVIE